MIEIDPSDALRAGSDGASLEEGGGHMTGGENGR